MMSDEGKPKQPMPCRSCDEGDVPSLLDIDGVRCDISGNAGCWAHAYEDNWWPCQRKAAEEHAEIERLQADLREMARLLCCLEPDEYGRPSCDPPCIACRYTNNEAAQAADEEGK